MLLQMDNSESDSPAAYNSLTLADLPPMIVRCLRAGHKEKISALATEIVQWPPALHRWLDFLQKTFVSRGSPTTLIELLWRNRDIALNDMFVVGHFMRLCTKTDTYSYFGPLFRSWAASKYTADFRFSECGHLQSFKSLTSEQRNDFVRAKYRKWQDLTAREFLEAIDEFSVYADVSPPITRFLFGKRRNKDEIFANWFRNVRSAELLKHIQIDIACVGQVSTGEDTRKFPQFPDLASMIDMESARSVLSQLNNLGGLLLATFHGAHVSLANRCFLRLMPEHYVFATNSGQNRINVLAGRGSAGFRAFKALRDDRILLMAPDGRKGVGNESSMTVMGIRVPVADGAPTIAYEADCATTWYSMVRDGERFVPVCAPGPKRLAGENFEEFRERWWAFYAGHIERILTGDPRNISLIGFWPELINSAGVEALMSA